MKLLAAMTLAAFLSIVAGGPFILMTGIFYIILKMR